jgi:hypothetical protein
MCFPWYLFSEADIRRRPDNRPACLVTCNQGGPVMDQPFDLEMDFMRLKAQLGSRIQILFYQIFTLAVTGQSFHLYLDDDDPRFSVQIGEHFIQALTENRDPNRLPEMLSKIPLRDGTDFSLRKTQAIRPVPLN